jgi:hypothetical protein
MRFGTLAAHGSASLSSRLIQVQSADTKRESLDRMAAIAEAEKENARIALSYVARDSRIGYANAGRNDNEGVARGGIYSAESIRKKIEQIEHMLHEEIPAFRRAQGLN